MPKRLGPKRLGPKRLGAETSRDRNGLVPKRLVTEYPDTAIGSGYFISHSLVAHWLVAPRLAILYKLYSKLIIRMNMSK